MGEIIESTKKRCGERDWKGAMEGIEEKGKGGGRDRGVESI